MATFTSRGARLHLTNLATGAAHTIDNANFVTTFDCGTIRSGWPTFAEWQRRRAFTRSFRNATRLAVTINAEFTHIDAAAVAAAVAFRQLGEHL